MPDRDQLLQRQEVLADFGDFVLRNDDLDEVLTEACRLVSEELGTGRAKILEIEKGGESLLVRAGVGWASDVVGKLRLRMGERSSEAFSIVAGRPVISQDISKEDRFEVPPFMKEAGVVSLANAPIFLPGGRAFGLLQVDATEAREFTEEDTQFLRTYSSILGPVIDRLNKVRQLQNSTDRFRLVVENASEYAIFTTDTNNRIVDWFPGAEAVFGWSAEEAVGKDAAMIFTPEDLANHEHEKELATARRGDSAPDVRWHLRKNGSHVFIEGRVMALRDDEGALNGFIKIGLDGTEHRIAEQQLRRVQAWQTAFLEGMPQLVWRASEEGAWTWASPQWCSFTGLTEDRSLGMGWLNAVHPDDQETAAQIWQTLDQSSALATEVRLRKGTEERYRWFAVRATPVLDEAARATEWLGTFTDIHELRSLQEQQVVMVAELQHRTRNLIGVVRSIARETLKGTASLEEFRQKFNARLAALSRVQGLLSNTHKKSITLRSLLAAELEALGADLSGNAVLVNGPDVVLRSGIVQTLALALHELATNARKYGALAADEGKLAITWEIMDRAETGRRLNLRWHEEGITKGTTDAGGGYGRELIERALPYTLGAQTSFNLSQGQLDCRIELPLDDRGE